MILAGKVVQLKVDLRPSNIAGKDHLSELQSTRGIGIFRWWKLSRCRPIEQERKPPACRTNDLRRVGVGLIRTEKDVMQHLRLLLALDQEGHLPALIDHRPGQGDSPS